MGEVVSFRRKKLSGFIPDETVEEYRSSIDVMMTGALPLQPDRFAGFSDTAPCETNPDSGDCA